MRSPLAPETIPPSTAPTSFHAGNVVVVAIISYRLSTLDILALSDSSTAGIYGRSGHHHGPYKGCTRTSPSSAVIPSRMTMPAPLSSGPSWPSPKTKACLVHATLSQSNLGVFNVAGRVAADSEFRCLGLGQAFACTGVKHDVRPETYLYGFNRSYKTPGYDPNAPVCDAPAPKTAARPHGDPDGEYFKVPLWKTLL